MTKEYEKRLIKLAEELIAIGNKGGVGSEGEIRQLLFTTKVNHLLGYILALKELYDPTKGN